jgi:uncharacterized protein DUF3892
MGKIYEKIIKRYSKNESDQEFQVCKSDDFNDGKFRGYDQTPRYEKESDIIKKIEWNEDYRTDDTTLVEVGNRNGKKYIHSIPNNTKKDNIVNLPTY